MARCGRKARALDLWLGATVQRARARRIMGTTVINHIKLVKLGKPPHDHILFCPRMSHFTIHIHFYFNYSLNFYYQLPHHIPLYLFINNWFSIRQPFLFLYLYLINFHGQSLLSLPCRSHGSSLVSSNNSLPGTHLPSLPNGP